MGKRTLRADDFGSRKAEAGDIEDEFPVTKQKTKWRVGKDGLPTMLSLEIFPSLIISCPVL